MSYSSATLELAVEAYELGNGAGALLADFEPDPALLDARAQAQLQLEKEALLRIRDWASAVRAAMSGLDQMQRPDAPKALTPELVLAIEKVRANFEVLHNQSQHLRRSVADPRVVHLLNSFAGVVAKALEQLVKILNDADGYAEPALVSGDIRFFQRSDKASEYVFDGVNKSATSDLANYPNALVAIADAVRDVTSSIEKLGRVLGTQEGEKSKLLGSQTGSLAQLNQVHKNFAQLIRRTEALGALGDQERAILVKGVETWIAMSDRLLTSLDGAEASFLSSPRHIKRKFGRDLEAMRRSGNKVAEIRDMMIDFGESLDPTPDGYLVDEVQKIHGDRSESILELFSELASAKSSTIELFKQRHNLK